MSCLRVHDNPALNHSISNSKKRFRAVFIIDPWFACGERKFGVNRLVWAGFKASDNIATGWSGLGSERLTILQQVGLGWVQSV